jgi:type II secretory pathway pseudopilin PulG
LQAVAARVRWDKLGRIAMLCVLVVLAYLSLSAGVSVFKAWREAKQDSANVLYLEHQNKALETQRNMLSTRSSLEGRARQLDWAHPGEQPYVVKGLPPN